MNDNFDIEIQEDGKMKVTSTGGFSKVNHSDADDVLRFIKEAMNGECITKKLPRDLANPHQESKQENKLGVSL
jgi:hypothetical protein